jgi:hypothetical protein
MGCGDLEGGEAWTFTCPPGHRIVGYSSSTLVEVQIDEDKDEDNPKGSSGDVGSVFIARIRFVTASF